MKLFESKAIVLKSKVLHGEDKLFGELKPELINWTLEGRDGEAIISFGFPVEYKTSVFLDEKLEGHLCLYSANVGGSSVFLPNFEVIRIRNILASNRLQIAVLAALTVESESDRTTKSMITLVTRGTGVTIGNNILQKAKAEENNGSK